MRCEYCGKEFEVEEMSEDSVGICVHCEAEGVMKCEECGEWTREDEGSSTYDNTFICGDCRDEYYSYCSCCDSLHHMDSLTYVELDGELVCENCIDEGIHYFVCYDCGEVHSARENYIVYRGEMICECCADDNYRECWGCGEVYHVDDMTYDEYENEWYCDECARDNGHGLIDSYHTHVNWMARRVDDYDKSNLIGCEVEVEFNDDDSVMIENAQLLRDIYGNENRMIELQRDGSLDCGFEVISHPYTFNYWNDNRPLESVLKSLSKNGGKSHDTDTCGLHFHVNRGSLETNTSLCEEQVIDNIMLLMETFREELIAFSRRKEHHLNNYAKFLTNDEDKEIDMEVVKEKKQNVGYDRYVALNTSNANTIEFRIFKGTLKHSTFMASLQLVNNIVEISKGNVQGVSWKDIVDFNPNSVELIEYANNRVTSFNINKLVVVEELIVRVSKKNFMKSKIIIDLSESPIQHVGMIFSKYYVNKDNWGYGYDNYVDSGFDVGEYKYLVCQCGTLHMVDEAGVKERASENHIVVALDDSFAKIIYRL